MRDLLRRFLHHVMEFAVWRWDLRRKGITHL